MQNKETSIALGVVAAETRGRVAAQHSSGSFPWIGVDPSEMQTANMQWSPIFSWVDPKNSLGLTTHVMLCKRTEAWRTCGTWMMVTSCVTRSWCCPTARILMTPTPKLEHSEICRRKKSSTTSQTWTQPHLNRTLTRCGYMPSPPLEARHAESLWDPDRSSRTSSWSRGRHLTPRSAREGEGERENREREGEKRERESRERERSGG